MNTYTAHTAVEIKAPVARVWEALTKPEIVQEYLFGTQMETTWQIGDPITYSGIWQGKSYQDKGKVLAFEPMQKIVTTYWSGMSGLPDKPENYQEVTYALQKISDEETKLTISQSNTISQENVDHSISNWQMVLEKLKELLEKK